MTTLTHDQQSTSAWIELCSVEDLVPERGVAALLPALDADHPAQQIALFRTFDGAVFATQQLDPYSEAFVMSRGIVGDYKSAPTVASPVYKQVFDLATGVCVNPQSRDRRNLAVYPVEVHAGVVCIQRRH